MDGAAVGIADDPLIQVVVDGIVVDAVTFKKTLAEKLTTYGEGATPPTGHLEKPHAPPFETLLLDPA